MVTATSAKDTRQRKKRRATMKGLGISALIVVILGGGAWYVRDRKSQAATADVTSLYQTQAATKGNLYVTVSGSGMVEPANKAQVKTKVKGDVLRFVKMEGDYVKEGEVIAELDPTDVENSYRQAEVSFNAAKIRLEQAQKDAALFPTQAQSSVEQAKASYLTAKQKLEDLLAGPKDSELEQQRSAIRQAQASYDNALVDFNRQKKLYDQGAVSKATLESVDAKRVAASEQLLSAKQKLLSLTEKASGQEVATVKAQLQQAEANLKLAQANAGINTKEDTLAQAKSQYETAKSNLETARKSRSSTGVVAPISGILWSVTAVIGDTLQPENPFATIVDTRSLLVRVQVDETDIQKIVVGQQSKVTTDAIENADFMGKVARIAPEATSNNGVSTYDVIVALDGANSTLKPGMNADVEILVDYSTDAVMVPISSVMNNNGRQTAIVMEKGEPSFRRITVGKQNDSYMEIVSGIDAREPVVTNPTVGTQSTTGTTGSTNGSNRFGGGAMGMMGGFGGGR